jgi:hypothetical protein
MLQTTADKLHARSIALVQHLDTDMGKILLIWTALASLACGLRIMVTWPAASLAYKLTALAPYVLVVGAPVASLLLAMHWFRDAQNFPQPRSRLARVGRWRQVSAEEARSMPHYGVTGIMASLLLGMLINVPVRSLEFLAAIPAVTAHPHWLGPLSTLMLADVVLLSSLYCVAFVAAFRRVPLFPRLLVAIWLIDILMQLLIARVMAGEGLPAGVEQALATLLTGNVKKVLISVGLWLPYLLLSQRVNVTYRHRVPA